MKVVDKGKIDEKVVELLLDHGADVNAKNKGMTVLMKAVEKENKNITELLLKNGADANAQDDKKDTALMKAVNKGNKEITELLLKRNADANIQGNKKETALMMAVKKKNKEIAALLLKYGADVDLKNDEGKNVFYMADTDMLLFLEDYVRNYGVVSNQKYVVQNSHSVTNSGRRRIIHNVETRVQTSDDDNKKHYGRRLEL
jgi:ankyrin repeat protein